MTWKRIAFVFNSAPVERFIPWVSILARSLRISEIEPCTVESGISVLPIVAAEFVLEQPVKTNRSPALRTATSFLTFFTKSPFEISRNYGFLTGATIEVRTSIVQGRTEVSPISPPAIQFGAVARATNTVDVAVFTIEPG